MNLTISASPDALQQSASRTWEAPQARVHRASYDGAEAVFRRRFAYRVLEITRDLDALAGRDLPSSARLRLRLLRARRHFESHPGSDLLATLDDISAAVP